MSERRQLFDDQMVIRGVINMFEVRQLFNDQMIMFEGSERVIAGIACYWQCMLLLASRHALLLASRVIVSITGYC
jgi:hypothetical protein